MNLIFAHHLLWVQTSSSVFLPHSCFTFSSLFLLSRFVAGGYGSKGLDTVQSRCSGMENNLVVLFYFILKSPVI